MKNSASNGKAHRKIDGKQLAHSIGEAASAAADNVGKTAVSVAGKTKELASKSQEASMALCTRTATVKSTSRMSF